MKVLSVDGLSKLISLMKEDFVESSSLSTVATSGSYNDLTNKPTIPTIDQTYSSSSTSTNALSHKAIADAKFIQNTATGLNSTTIEGIATSQALSVNIGKTSIANSQGAVAIGSSASVNVLSNYGIAIGCSSITNGAYAIQLGKGTNSEANSFYVGLSDSNNYKLLSSDGTIPNARLNVMTGADGTNAGTKGAVPAPAATDNTKFFRGDGTWATVSQPSIATTSTAGLVKPDGTSITVTNDGTISTEIIEIDDETITKNDSDELQTVAIVNPNTNNGAISPLKIWNGTEYQWNHGEPTVWNYWQTDVQAMWQNGNDLSLSQDWQTICYGNNTFLVVGYYGVYSTDGGVTWQNCGLSGVLSHCSTYANNRFIIIDRNSTIYSSNGYTWQNGGSLPGSANRTSVIYGDDRFITVPYSSDITAYSTDGGVTWQSGGNLPSVKYWRSIAYGDGSFVAVSENSDEAAYSTDGGITWQSSTLPSSGSRFTIVYGNDRFITIKRSSNEAAYSTDGGRTWQRGGNLPSSANWCYLAYGDGKFLVTTNNSDEAAYSTDGGVTWQSSTLPSSGRWIITYGDNAFWGVKGSSASSAIFSVTYDKCYTLDSTPTTSTQVYSEPEITSTKTITSVGSGTITLSDNLVYNSTPTGNQNTYRTLGAAHPDWICNINNVGVKIGNTIIATDGSDLLPSQTNNSGKFLTTNGTTASWETVPSGSSYTNGTGINISSGVISVNDSVLLNRGNTSTRWSLGILGSYSDVSSSSVWIGYGSYSYHNAVSLGFQAKANNSYSTAIGYNAVTSANYAIQLGYGTNSEANSFYVATSSSDNYKMLGSDGKIPSGRLQIATSVSSSSTNDETVGAKLFYDTVGDIESALQAINSGS